MSTLGERIATLREERGFGRAETAAAVPVSDVTLGNWERDINKPLSHNLVALARKLRTTTEWLITGQGSKDIVSNKQRATQSILLPVITLITAKNWLINRQLSLADAQDWRNTVANISDQSFFIRPEGDTVISRNHNPPIIESAYIVIDPNDIATDGSIALIATADSEKATLKKLVVDGQNKYLKPLNTDYKTIEYDKSCTIIGKAIRIEYDTET